MNRIQARNLIDREIKKTTGGITINDLPDSVTLCNGLDEMEGMDEDEATEYAIEVAVEMLEEEGFPI